MQRFGRESFTENCFVSFCKEKLGQTAIDKFFSSLLPGARGGQGQVCRLCPTEWALGPHSEKPLAYMNT